MEKSEKKKEATPAAINQDDIARLAYLYWEEGGRKEGTSQDNWLRAERALKGRQVYKTGPDSGASRQIPDSKQTT